jgi:hypothetical protein
MSSDDPYAAAFAAVASVVELERRLRWLIVVLVVLNVGQAVLLTIVVVS